MRAARASHRCSFGRPVTSAAKRPVPPRAADWSTRSTNECTAADVAPFRKTALRAACGRQSRSRRRFYLVGHWCRGSRVCVYVCVYVCVCSVVTRNRLVSARIPRLRHASVVGAETETKKERQATRGGERKSEEEVNVNRGVQPNLYRPAVIFQHTLGALGVAANVRNSRSSLRRFPRV